MLCIKRVFSGKAVGTSANH